MITVAVKKGLCLHPAGQLDNQVEQQIAFLSPAAGVVERIAYGPRRTIRAIVIRRDAEEEAGANPATPGLSFPASTVVPLFWTPASMARSGPVSTAASAASGLSLDPVRVLGRGLLIVLPLIIVFHGVNFSGSCSLPRCASMKSARVSAPDCRQLRHPGNLPVHGGEGIRLY